MVSAVILAGYNKHEVAQYQAALRKGDEFLPGYKALLDFKDYLGKPPISKPLLQFTLDCLENVDSIDDIVIVGDAQRINEKLSGRLGQVRKAVKVIDQAENLDERVIDALGIAKAGIPYGTLCENALKAYSHTQAYAARDGALFFTSDTPLIKPGRIGEFLLQLGQLPEDAAIVYPLVAMDKEAMSIKRLFRRGYFYMVNDTHFPVDNPALTTISKRHGFRISAYMYANPFRCNLYIINTAYSMRKMESWAIRKQVAGMLLSSGLVNMLWKYLFRTLKITDVEKAATRLLANEGNKVIIMPTDDILSTYDFDALRREKVGLRWLMKHENHYL